MEHLFFNSDKILTDVATSVFETLGTESFGGESTNVLNGTYVETRIFGLLIRVEENSYDYEDRYAYMLSVKRDVIGNVHVRDGDIAAIARSIQHILADNMKIDVALEVGTTIELCTPAV
jgi:hypothetical protein